MAETTPIPEAWIGQDVHVRFSDGGEPRSRNGTIREVNDRGICVDGEGKTSFFPWNNIVEVDLGHVARRTKLGLR